MQKSFKAITLCLALLLCAAALPAQAAVFNSNVRVLISTEDEKTLSFTPVGEFALQEYPDLEVGNDELTITAAGSRVSITLDGETVTAPSLTLLSGHYDEKSDYIRLKNAEYGTCTYLGNMTFDVAGGNVRAINTLPIELYIYGVVPHEMSNAFPIEALKAQAVCARGYAVTKSAKNASRGYDLVDTSKDQVYRGYASKNARAIAAVDATAGQIMTYDGDFVEAFYSASNGGQTEKTGNVWTDDLPYFAIADDPFDLMNASSIEEKSFIPAVFDETTRALMDTSVLLSLERAANEAAGAEAKLLSTVSVVPTAASFDEPSRCYTEAEVTLMVSTGAAGEQKQGQLTVTLLLEEQQFGSFENTLGRIGAKKTRLRMLGAERGVYEHNGQTYSGWYLTARRYGHGVGLSQRSAQERARRGQSYTEMLSFYYVNTVINTVGSYDTAPRLKSDTYKVKSWGVSGIKPGLSADDLLKTLSSDGKLSLVDAKGNAKTETLKTGDFVRTTYNEGKAFFDLPLIVYGDTNGDGAIDANDAETLRKHLLRAELLSGPYLEAADVDHDGSVDIKDLLKLIQHSQGDAKIS